MSKIGNILKMLFILKKNKKVKIKDLEEELNVNEKQIRRYKKELEEYFIIESTTGPDGGYELKQSYFPFTTILTKEEIVKLKIAIEAIEYENSKELQGIVDKLNFNLFNKQEEMLFTEELISYSKPKGEIENTDKYKDIYDAIINQKILIITYSGNNGESDRRIEPYKYIKYKGEYYIIARCLNKQDIRYFKLPRIKEYIITSYTFEKTIDIDEYISHERENSLGIFGGEVINIQLKIRRPMANTIKERIWVENQVIHDEGEYIIFEAPMKKGPEMTSWILSMGEHIEIIKPLELKEEIKEKLKNILSKI